MKKSLPILWLAIAFITTPSFSQAVLISQLDFNGNLNDNLANATCIQFNNLSTSFSSGSFNWVADSNGAGAGLKLTLPDALLNEDEFSVAITFRFAETSGYRKILDFTGRGNDAGLYVNSQLRIFGLGNYGPTIINPDSTLTILFTRENTTDTSRLYLWDGANLILESKASDLPSYMVPVLSGTDRQFYFFADDSITTDEYASSGNVEMIKIWNGVATLSDLLSTEDNLSLSKFKVYPNPVNDFVYVDFPSPTSGMLEIYSMSGQLVQSTHFSNQTHVQIAMDKLPAGMYLVKHEGVMVRVVKQ
jgi:hypothetical protein